MNRPLITIDPAALKRLEEFPFPGNIRELENMIERAIVVGNGKKITLKDLPLEKTVVSIQPLKALMTGKKPHPSNSEQIQLEHFAAAKALKVDRVTLYNKIKKYNLSRNMIKC